MYSVFPAVIEHVEAERDRL